MQRRGNINQRRVGRRIVYSFRSSTPETDAFFEAIERVVRQAMRELSILDTSIVDTDPNGM